MSYGENLVPHLHSYRTATGDWKEIETYAMVNEVFGMPSPDGDLHTTDLHTVNLRIKQGDGNQTMCLPDTIVIATESDGHHYFGIVTSQARYGQIHLWLDGLPDFEWSVKLGDTFTEFLEKIVDDPEL